LIPFDWHKRAAYPTLEVVGPRAPLVAECPMEALYRDCDARGPQLERNPLGVPPTNSMPRLALLISVVVSLSVARLPGQQSFAPTIGVSVGYQSSDSEHFVYAFHLAVPLGASWEFAPWYRLSTASQAQRRASLPLRRLFPLAPNAKWYAGAGVSWTEEIGEIQPHGHWGALVFVGSEYAPSALSWERARVRLFGEVQIFTYSYGTGQFLVGLRLRLGH
jgi:hypothetical protein